MAGSSKKKKTTDKKTKDKKKKDKRGGFFSCSRNKSKKKFKKMKKLKKKPEEQQKKESKKSTKKTVIRKKKKLPLRSPAPQPPAVPQVPEPNPFPAIVPPLQPEPWLITQPPALPFDNLTKKGVLEKDDGTISVSMKTAKHLIQKKEKKVKPEEDKEEKIKSPVDLSKKAIKTPKKKSSVVASASDRLPASAVISRPPEQSIHAKKFSVQGLSAFSWEYEDSRPEETLSGERPNLVEFLSESAGKIRQPLPKSDNEKKVCVCCKCRFRSAMAALP